MFEDLYGWVSTQLTQNEIFAGLIGGSVFASALYALRSVPARLWAVFLHQFTCIVTVYNDDEAFDWLNEWLATLPYSRRARRLKLGSFYSADAATWSLAPGPGNHLFWFRGRLVWMNRETEKSESGSNRGRRKESIELRVFTRRQAALNALIADAERLKAGGDMIEVWGYHGYWQKHDRRLPRSLDSVVLPEQQISALVADAEWFAAARDWYAERGVPYRRGYLLHGPPGCGKSSLVFALASHLGRPVYVLNLGSLFGDNSLFEALSNVPVHAVVLIEDIDVAKASRERRPKPRKPQQPRPLNAPAEDTADEDTEERSITMSGLLNAIDGVLSKEGRILVMTTNHVDALDEALVRPGRIDRQEHIGPLHGKEVERLFARFYPDNAEMGSAAGYLVTKSHPMTGAELQGMFLLHSDNADAALDVLWTRRQKQIPSDEVGR